MLDSTKPSANRGITSDSNEVHGVDAHGKVVLRKTLGRDAVSSFFFAKLPLCLIGMQASNGAHYWARVLSGFGHQIRLIASVRDTLRQVQHASLARARGDQDPGSRWCLGAIEVDVGESHRGSRHRPCHSHQEAGYTSAAVAVEICRKMLQSGGIDVRPHMAHRAQLQSRPATVLRMAPYQLP
jgi:hypothetical protein